ncbi:MAG: histone deacetylase family protein [Wenzhouxiangellaceae bacterium]
MNELLVVSHPDCSLHDPMPGHPERPERLEAVLDGIRRLDAFEVLDATEATREQLLRVHQPAYLDHLERIELEIREQNVTIALDADTHAAAGSLRAARLAAGAACQAAESAIQHPGRPAFAVVRPPGHHAEAGRAMGFCLYNSIAVAAAHALAQPGIGRVAICDFDVHHGNGTEAIFAGRRDVLFVSSHQMPLYPGTGDPRQKVAANIHNAGLPPGSGSDEFRGAWQAQLLDAVDRFAPDLLLISAGFDAHRRDPLAQINLDDQDFYWIGRQLKMLADKHANGCLAASLEGGYDLKALTGGALAFAEGLTLTH